MIADDVSVCCFPAKGQAVAVELAVVEFGVLFFHQFWTTMHLTSPTPTRCGDSRAGLTMGP